MQSSKAVCPISGDFNKDGIPDLLVNMNNGDLDFLMGNGDRTFANPLVTVLPQDTRAFVTGDFNGDGNLDIVGIFTRQAGGIEAFLGDGGGQFSAPILIEASEGASALVAADLNGDGLTDIVALNYLTDGVTVFLGIGKGAPVPQNYSLPQSALSAQIADLNLDGIPDLVVVGQTEVFILMGQGGGVFAQPTVLTATANSLVVTDMNGDGFPDLALDDGMEVKIFLGDGTGTFSYPGDPNGLWLGIAGTGTTIVAANLQSQSKASGLSDLITLGTYPGVGYVGELLNQAVAH